MPNIRGVTELNGPINLLTVLLGDGSTVVLTRAEADAYLAQHPTFSDAQLEAQFLNLVQGRWVSRTDNVAIHLIRRNPITVTIWLSSGPVPAQWWL